MLEVLDMSMWVLLGITFLVLGFGVLFLSVTESKFKKIPVIIYLGILLLIEMLSVVVFKDNLYLFSLSFFLHFSFLVFYYFRVMFKYENILFTVLLIGVGGVPMAVNLSVGYSTSSFQSYDRLLYDFIIMILSLSYFYVSLGRNDISKSSLVFNGFVLAFFTIDIFLAAGTNYLINESLLLVAWFWFFRAILLQLYYCSLIYHTWKTGKIP